MNTEERIQKEADIKAQSKFDVFLPHQASWRLGYIAGATIEAARNKENAVALEKEIERLKGLIDVCAETFFNSGVSHWVNHTSHFCEAADVEDINKACVGRLLRFKRANKL